MRNRWIRRAGVLMLSAAAPAAGQGQWVILAPLPAARQEVGVAALGGRVYVVGGFNAAGQSVNTVERYNPASNSWEGVAPLPAPMPLNHVGAAAVGGGLFVLGGLRQNFTSVASVYRYDPGSNQWTPRTNMPTARGAMGVAVIGDLIYAAGGLPAANNRDFASYNTVLNQWTPLPLMPTGRDHLAAAAVSGKFYAISGRNPALQFTVEMYDPVLNQWFSRAPILTPRGGIAAEVYAGRIYVFGGEGNAGNPMGVFSQVERFDPPNNHWALVSTMPVPRHGIGAAAIDRRIYIPGGGVQQGFGATAHHDTFVPCYPDCVPNGMLTVSDFTCFQLEFVLGTAYADCNQSGTLTIADYTCFQSAFIAGCP